VASWPAVSTPEVPPPQTRMLFAEASLEWIDVRAAMVSVWGPWRESRLECAEDPVATMRAWYGTVCVLGVSETRGLSERRFWGLLVVLSWE
jgi:hypothetical protein